MRMETIRHTAPLWRWSGSSGGNWFFITIDGEAGEMLSATRLMRRLETGTVRGFGSMRVFARIGESRWSTSVFPQKEGGWLLPVKASIRCAEEIGEGDRVELALEF
ncbi:MULTISPECIES: DUF1905 domain-containing protein [Sphingobium]|jgi:hypothetical protein|nr:MULTISPECIES: DUF1905 domain-containing protein [Sphingobium]